MFSTVQPSQALGAVLFSMWIGGVGGGDPGGSIMKGKWNFFAERKVSKAS